MWYIWKARNDNRFQRRTWTSSQVHHATAAHLNTHRIALGEIIEGVAPINTTNQGLQQQQANPNMLEASTTSQTTCADPQM
jgi:spore germination protein GerM